MNNPTITDLVQRLLDLRRQYGDLECHQLTFWDGSGETEKTPIDFAVVTDPDDNSKKLLTLD